MAQPTGQVLVNTGHALAGSLFVYANGTGLWDASAGAMLTKTGTGAVSAEGGANVINSAGTTYFDLGTVITTSAPFSFGFRARTTANNNSSMVAGERTSSNSYIWLNNGSNQLVAKVTGNSGQVAAGATTTMATYWIVRDASNNVSFYKDGVQVTPTRWVPGAFILRNLLAGYTSGTYSLNGAAEFFHFIPSAISAGDVASLSADPYQVLVAAAGVDGNAAGVTLVATASMVAGGVSGGSGSSITVTSPAPYQARQRNKATNTATLSVALTYTGAPTGFEYRFAGGAWAALGGVPSGGSHAATVSLPVGQGAFEVRFANDTGVTASVAGVTVGKVFATAGQSNACGRATAAIAPVAGASGTAVKLGRDAVWKPLTEGLSGSGITYDEGTSAAGSCWGPVSNRLQAQAVPMAFIPVAQGSTSIADWARYDADPSNPYFLYGDLWQAWLAAGGLEGVIYWQGEYEATAGMSQAAYTTPLNTLVNNIWSDFGVETLIVQIVNWVAGAAAIRAAQADVAATNPHAAGLADANVWSGDVHYRTLAEVNAVADVLAPAMVSAFYSTSASASGATLTATASLLPGAASGQRNATASGVVLPASASLLAGAASGAGNAVAGGITLAAVAQLLAGIASGGSASTAPGATLVASAALLSGAASGQASATASGVVWAASASLVAGIAENGSIVWPDTPAGPTHRALVPFGGVRAIVTAETIEA